MGRYKVLTGEFADLMLGYYGATLGERNPEVVAMRPGAGEEGADHVRPADLLQPEWDAAAAEAPRRSPAATAPTRTC